MEICIRKNSNNSNYIDKTALNRFNKETLSQAPYNFTFVEINDKYADCVASDFNEDLTFSIDKYNIRKERPLLEKELSELEQWFLYYDNQVAQYSRCVRLDEEFDLNINELDNQAKINANRIKELRNLLNKEE